VPAVITGHFGNFFERQIGLPEQFLGLFEAYTLKLFTGAMPDLRSETAPQRVDRKAGVLSGFVDGGIFTGMAADELNRPTHVRVGRGEERGGHAFGDAFGRKQLLAVLYFLARQLRIQQAGGFETDLLGR